MPEALPGTSFHLFDLLAVAYRIWSLLTYLVDYLEQNVNEGKGEEGLCPHPWHSWAG
jgi:hypothetical protein